MKNLLILITILFMLVPAVQAQTFTGVTMTGSSTTTTAVVLTKYANADVDVSIGLTLNAGKFTIDWGDGEQTHISGPAVYTNYLHTYASTTSDYAMSITGDFDAITYFALATADPWIGDIAVFSRTPSLTQFLCRENLVFGDTSVFINMTSLTVLRIRNTLISGDIADFALLVGLTSLRANDTSIDTYTQGVLPNWDACEIQIQNLGLSQQEVDDFLCDLDASSVASTKTLDISGTNSAPSATGLTCKTSLEGKGWTVTVTP